MRRWSVAGAILESSDGMLLVENRRFDGRVDWTPPGGVIEDAEGEELLAGLTREVEEETGLCVVEWDRLLYRVEAFAPDLGWHMTAHIWRAHSWRGELTVGDDPDGIVTAALWSSEAARGELLASAQQWVGEPLLEWCRVRWDVEPEPYRYRVDGTPAVGFSVSRIEE